MAAVDHLIGVKFEMVTHDDMNYLKNKRIHSIAAIRNHPNIWISWGNVYFFKFLLTFIYVCVYIYILGVDPREWRTRIPRPVSHFTHILTREIVFFCELLDLERGADFLHCPGYLIGTVVYIHIYK